MPITPSERIRSIPAYAFAEVGERVEALRAKGIEPIDFGVGDPADPTPELIRRALQRAADERAASGYPSYIGSPELRRAVADWSERRFGVAIDPDRHVCATVGSKEAVFNFPHAFLDPGDRVLVPSPGYPPFQRGTLFAGGTTVFYPLRAENRFRAGGALTDEMIADAKILWVNYPHSPSGTVVDLDELAALAERCRRYDTILASDEAYVDVYFTDAPPPSILQTGLEGVVAFHSMSKRSAMTGYRIGWVVGDEQIVGAFKKLKTNIDSGTPTFIQDAAVVALGDDDHVEAFRAMYRRKRDLLVGALAGAGLPACPPDGTLFVWQRVPEGMTSVEFAARLLEPEIAIVTTPGAWLGDDVDGAGNTGEGYVRFALVPTLADCERAAERIRRNLGGR